MLIEYDKVRERQKKRVKKRIKLFDKEYNNKDYIIEFLTITFKSNEDFYVFKTRKQNSFLSNLKKNYGFRKLFLGCGATKRGVAHYHYLLVRKKGSKRIGFVDMKKAYKFIVGYTNIKTVKTKIYYYLLKYLEKDIENNNRIYIEKSKGSIKKIVRIRYRRYGFGGKIRKSREYKEIMLSYIEKKLREYGIEIRDREIIKGDVKIKYGFEIERHNYIEAIEIKTGYIIRYERKYKNLLEYDWEEIYRYDMNIMDFEDYKMFVKIILFELGIEEEN